MMTPKIRRDSEQKQAFETPTHKTSFMIKRWSPVVH